LLNFLQSGRRVISGGASHTQMGKAADYRDNYPKGAPERKDLNKIVHCRENQTQYGAPGVWNQNAQDKIDAAKKK